MNLPWFTKYPYQNDEILNLDWVLSELSKFKEAYETLDEIIAELKEQLKELDDWENRIEALENLTSSMAATIPVIEKAIADLSNLQAADVKYLKQLIDDLQNQINALDISALKAYVDSRDNELMADYNNKIYENYVVTYSLFNALKERVELLAKIIADLDTKAYNPWARRLTKESLQQNLDYAYADLADLVPTAEEYASLGLSAEAYEDYEMLARDYCLRGKKILRLFYVYSPTFGFKQEINNVLTSIVNFVKGTMSADEYTALDIDADAYTALDISAAEYYSYNNSLGYIGTGGSGLSSTEYSSLQVL